MTATNFQQGILDHPLEHLLVVALNFVGQPQPVAALTTVQQLQTLVRRELAADIDEITDDPSTRTSAATESGELGVTDGYDTAGLTVTFGISSTGMTALGVPAAQLPQDLIPVPWARFSDTPPSSPNGDVVLQISSDSSYIVEHVLRRIEFTLSAEFSVAWTLLGEQRYGGGSHSSPTADSARALIGFHDGLSNLDPSLPGDVSLIFVDPLAVAQYPAPPPAGPQPAPGPGTPGYNPAGGPQPSFPTGLRTPPTSEPSWTKDGSYLFVRASVINTPAWDATTLGQQEQTIGRWKDSGATLDNPDHVANRHDDPQFATSPASVVVPPDSHIRRANPRSQPSDALRRIFRRGYPLIAATPSGSLQRGLIFVAFARSLSTQAEFILAAWLKNPDFPVAGSGIDPLLKFETGVIAGGYFFVPPLVNPEEPWSWDLPPQS